MKYKDIKKVIDKMNEEELNQTAIFNSENYSISGPIKKLKKNAFDLYWDGEGDPSALYTKKELKERGFDKEEIESCSIEIPKGNYFIELD